MEVINDADMMPHCEGSSVYWDWDNSPSGSVSPTCKGSEAAGCRGRADSGSTWISTSSHSSLPCRSSSLSFSAGECARLEYSSPRSPRFCLDVSGDELEALLRDDFREGEPPELQLDNQRRSTWNADAAFNSRNPTSVRSNTVRAAATHQNSVGFRQVISPSDLASGEFDYQGIPWSRFSISRTEYRAKRVREYSNYNNVNWNAQLEFKRRLDIDRVKNVSHSHFRFYETSRGVNPTIDHFQLRHLLWASSSSDQINALLYYVSNSTLFSFNKRTKKSKKISATTHSQQLASCHVDHGLAVTGAFDSEVKVTRLLTPDSSGEISSEHIFDTKISTIHNSITNHVCVLSPEKILCGNNDSYLTEIDLREGGRIADRTKFPFAVNHVSYSLGDHRLFCVSGDSCDALLVDSRSKMDEHLVGHLDFTFCSSWLSPNVLCTGSQDGTCRVWDIRKAHTPLKCVGALLGAVRCAKFSNDGRWLAFSEPADFVHVYDVHSNFASCQTIDFFGNIAGIAFSPDSSSLSVAIADTMFGCLIDFQLGSLPVNLSSHSSVVAAEHF